MFISIIRIPEDAESQHCTSMYECDRYILQPVKDSCTEFVITIECPLGVVTAVYDTNETGLGIYVMNKDGRTVDTIFRSK